MRCAGSAHASVRHRYGVKIGLEPITLKTPCVLRAAAMNQLFFARAGLIRLVGPRGVARGASLHSAGRPYGLPTATVRLDTLALVCLFLFFCY